MSGNDWRMKDRCIQRVPDFVQERFKKLFQCETKNLISRRTDEMQEYCETRFGTSDDTIHDNVKTELASLLELPVCQLEHIDLGRLLAILMQAEEYMKCNDNPPKASLKPTETLPREQQVGPFLRFNEANPTFRLSQNVRKAFETRYNQSLPKLIRISKEQMESFCLEKFGKFDVSVAEMLKATLLDVLDTSLEEVGEYDTQKLLVTLMAVERHCPNQKNAAGTCQACAALQNQWLELQRQQNLLQQERLELQDQQKQLQKEQLELQRQQKQLQKEQHELQHQQKQLQKAQHDFEHQQQLQLPQLQQLQSQQEQILSIVQAWIPRAEAQHHELVLSPTENEAGPQVDEPMPTPASATSAPLTTEPMAILDTNCTILTSAAPTIETPATLALPSVCTTSLTTGEVPLVDASPPTNEPAPASATSVVAPAPLQGTTLVGDASSDEHMDIDKIGRPVEPIVIGDSCASWNEALTSRLADAVQVFRPVLRHLAEVQDGRNTCAYYAAAMALHDVGPDEVTEDMLQSCSNAMGNVDTSQVGPAMLNTKVESFAANCGIGFLTLRQLMYSLRLGNDRDALRKVTSRARSAERNIIFVPPRPDTLEMGHFFFMHIPLSEMSMPTVSLVHHSLPSEFIVPSSLVSPASSVSSLPATTSSASSSSASGAGLSGWQYCVYDTSPSSAQDDVTRTLEQLGATRYREGFSSTDERENVAAYVAGYVLSTLTRGKTVCGLPTNKALQTWWNTIGEAIVGKEKAKSYERSIELGAFTPLTLAGLKAVFEGKGDVIFVEHKALWCPNTVRATAVLVHVSSGDRTCMHCFVVHLLRPSPQRPPTVLSSRGAFVVPKSTKPLHTLEGAQCFITLHGSKVACRVCRSAIENNLVTRPSNSRFATEGVSLATGAAGTRQRDEHLKTQSHRDAREALKTAYEGGNQVQSNGSCQPPPPNPDTQDMEQWPSDNDRGLFNMHTRMYVGVVNGLSHSAIVNGLQGEVLQKVVLEKRYRNRTALREVINGWAQLLLAKVRSELLADGPDNIRPLFVVVDASTTPHAGDDVVAARLRYVDMAQPALIKEQLLGVVHNVSPGSDDVSATGRATVEAIKKLLEPLSLGLADIDGWCSDDGSTMTGKRNGAASIIAGETGRSNIGRSLDAAHKIQTQLDFVQTVPAFKELTTVLRSVSKVFRASNCLRRFVRDLMSKQGKRALKADGSWRIRWLKKWARSFTKAVRMRQAWIACFETKDVFKRAQKKKKKSDVKVSEAARERLFSKLSDERFLQHLDYCNRLFSLLAAPQLSGQFEATQGALIALHLRDTQRKVASMTDVPGAFLDMHLKIVEVLTPTNMLSQDVRWAVEVLDIAIARELIVDPQYGNHAWQRMCQLTFPDVALDNDLASGWMSLKQSAQLATHRNFVDFWRSRLEDLTASTSAASKRVGRVVQFALCCGCASSCGVERDFGVMRARVAGLRNCLGVKNINSELIVARHGPSPFDVSATIDFLKKGIKHWKSSKARAHTGGRPKKAHAESVEKMWDWVQAMHDRNVAMDPSVSPVVALLSRRALHRNKAVATYFAAAVTVVVCTLPPRWHSTSTASAVSLPAARPSASPSARAPRQASLISQQTSAPKRHLSASGGGQPNSVKRPRSFSSTVSAPSQPIPHAVPKTEPTPNSDTGNRTSHSAPRPSLSQPKTTLAGLSRLHAPSTGKFQRVSTSRRTSVSSMSSSSSSDSSSSSTSSSTSTSSSSS